MATPGASRVKGEETGALLEPRESRRQGEEPLAGAVAEQRSTSTAPATMQRETVGRNPPPSPPTLQLPEASIDSLHRGQFPKTQVGAKKGRPETLNWNGQAEKKTA